MFSSLLTFFLGALVSSCPAVGSVPDINCDGKAVVTVIGDSLVVGRGDSIRGGYVTRAKKQLPRVTLNNFGKLGMETGDLINRIDKAFTGNKDTNFRDTILASDVVVLDLGRNDRWNFGTPIAAYRNLKRSAERIRALSLKHSGTAPLVVTAVLLLPNRGAQGPWVKELNAYILKGNSLNRPSDLRFDLVSKRLLSADQLHPRPEGYAALAKTFHRYLTITLPKKLNFV